MQQFITQKILLLGEGRGPLPSYEMVEKLMLSPSGVASALANAERFTAQGIEELSAPKLGTFTKEALAQNPVLVEKLNSTLTLSEADKKAACAVDAKYGKGAQRRDQILLGAQIGLTVATLGSAGAAMVTTNTSLSALRGAVSAGQIATRSANVLGRAAVIADIGVGAVQTAKECYGGARATDPGGDCAKYQPEQLARDNCVLTAAINGLNLGATLVALKRLPRSPAPSVTPASAGADKISLTTEAATTRFADYDKVKWKKSKLPAMFGDDAHEIRDAAVKSTATNSYVRYSVNPADDKIKEPHILIDMVRGDPAREGLGQYLIKKVAEENPGKPIYGALARENGARFKRVFRDLEGADVGSVQNALQEVPALRSIPGRAVLVPTYDGTGNLVDIGVLRYPDYSQSRVVVENANQLMSDPRFKRWVESLRSRPPSYFDANPEFADP